MPLAHKQPLIEELPYDDAYEFLRDLSPVAILWGKTGGVWDENNAGGQRNWIFRGQRDATWKLTPKAMRPGALVHYGIGVKAVESPINLSAQLDAESAEVSRFVRRCIRAGLPIPEDSQWFRNERFEYERAGRPTNAEESPDHDLRIEDSSNAHGSANGGPRGRPRRSHARRQLRHRRS